MITGKSRKDLAREIVAAAEAILDEGSFKVGGSAASRYHCTLADVGSLRIARCPPLICVDGHVHGSAVVDIWAPDNGRVTKVFSADTDPLCLIEFQMGGWIEELIPCVSVAS